MKIICITYVDLFVYVIMISMWTNILKFIFKDVEQFNGPSLEFSNANRFALRQSFFLSVLPQNFIIRYIIMYKPGSLMKFGVHK